MFRREAGHRIGLNGSIGPRDGLEALLTIQMVATHGLAMQCFAPAAIKDQTDLGVEVNLNRASRLMRTFAGQVEALKEEINVTVTIRWPDWQTRIGYHIFLRSSAWLELAHIVAELTRHPDVRAVEGHAKRVAADGEPAQHAAIAGP
jgi:hypothetical protein